MKKIQSRPKQQSGQPGLTLSHEITQESMIPANVSVNGHQQVLFEVEAVNAKKEQTHKRENDYVFDIVDALSAPILTFSTQWSDTIPKRMFNIVPLARMKALMQNEQLATYAECVIYIYTRSLDAPMNSDWTDIYTHISCQTLEESFGEDRWKDVGAPKKLNEWLLSKLNDLRRNIYNKRREILSKQLKEQERTEKRIPAKEDKGKAVPQQQSFFLW